MIFKAFSLQPPQVTSSSFAGAFGPRSLNLMAICALATKKLLFSGKMTAVLQQDPVLSIRCFTGQEIHPEEVRRNRH